MKTTVYLKDPQATLDFHVDWTTWLAGDTISVSAWTVPTGVTQVTVSNTTAVASIWLSGGTAGEIYSVVNRITTAAGRIDERTIVIRVEDR